MVMESQSTQLFWRFCKNLCSILISCEHFLPYIFVHSRWPLQQLQIGVICVVICSHLNMSFNYLVLKHVLLVVHSLWESCFLIWMWLVLQVALLLPVVISHSLLL